MYFKILLQAQSVSFNQVKSNMFNNIESSPNPHITIYHHIANFTLVRGFNV